MRDIERAKTQLIVRRIEAGDFDANDVDALFMRLRAYAGAHRVFREFGDFVAHNDERNRGLANDALLRMQLGLRYLMEHVLVRPGMDFTQPFPGYILRLFRLQLPIVKALALRERFNVTPERLAKRIEHSFKVDRKADLGQLVGKISTETVRAMHYVLGELSITPAFTQAQLMADILSVLRFNRISFNEAAMLAAGDRITLCAILLLHGTKFALGSDAGGKCVVTGEIDPRRDFVADLGNIQVSGLVDVKKKNGGTLTALTCVMTTDLSAASWCDAAVLRPKSPEAQSKGRVLLVEEPLTINAAGVLDYLH